MYYLCVDTLVKYCKQIGMGPLFARTINDLRQDFQRWPDFHKSSRHATHYPHGVIELMPCADDTYYAYKYVNGHPGNPQHGRLSVFGLGMLSDVASGYPLLLSEMTLLTAIRTAATAALAADYLARAESSHLAIIGTGAQAEFLALAINQVRPLTKVSYFDKEAKAMQKFAANLANQSFVLQSAHDIRSAIQNADIVVTATAAKQQNHLIVEDMIEPGQCYLALGGDCPGKTEFDPNVLRRCTVVVEYLPQSLIEGEIQQVGADCVHAELWELINGSKTGRQSATEITLFDSVGFALEDFSILKSLYLAIKQGELTPTGTLDMVPNLSDPKNLFGLLSP